MEISVMRICEVVLGQHEGIDRENDNLCTEIPGFRIRVIEL